MNRQNTYDDAIRKLQELHTNSKGSLSYKKGVKACIRKLQDDAPAKMWGKFQND